MLHLAPHDDKVFGFLYQDLAEYDDIIDVSLPQIIANETLKNKQQQNKQKQTTIVELPNSLSELVTTRPHLRCYSQNVSSNVTSDLLRVHSC